MKLLSRIIPIFMATMITLLVSGLITINIQHHLNIPKEILNRNTIAVSHFVSLVPPFLHKDINIYMVDEIRSYRQTQDIIEILNEASSGDVVTFHLAGYGGGVEQVFRILNAMLTSKADVRTIIEAPVYSGHAFIALYGKEITFLPFTFAMLHTSSAFSYNCDKDTGTNRAMTNADSCRLMLRAHFALVNTTINNLAGLSDKEKEIIMSGHDLYLLNNTGKVINIKNSVYETGIHPSLVLEITANMSEAAKKVTEELADDFEF